MITLIFMEKLFLLGRAGLIKILMKRLALQASFVYTYIQKVRDEPKPKSNHYKVYTMFNEIITTIATFFTMIASYIPDVLMGMLMIFVFIVFLWGMLFPEGTTVTEVVEFIKNPVVVNESDREEIIITDDMFDER